jgi:hypothetical protein
MEVKFTEEDLRLLALCNSIAGWGYWRRAKLFYALKDAVLVKYGERDGYDKQTWEEEDWNDPKHAHATHSHILERWLLLGQTFHRPTNEFKYFNYEYQTGKYSERYSELSKVCKNKLKGRKLHESKMPYTDFRRMARTVGWPALKMLVRRFGNLVERPAAPCAHCGQPLKSVGV